MEKNNLANYTKILSLAEWLPDTNDLMEQKSSSLHTGFYTLDSIINGLDRQYVSITGKPGSGKTALACTIASNNLASDRAILFISLEIGTLLASRRFLSLYCNKNTPLVDVPINLLKKEASLTPDQATSLSSGIILFNKIKPNLYIADGSSKYGSEGIQFVDDIKSAAIELSQNYGNPCLVIIDYFQLLNTRDSVGTSTDKYDKISSILASIAHNVGCGVIALCSVGKDGKIRGSSQVDFDCDISLSLDIDAAKTNIQEVLRYAIRPMVIKVKKNRNGAVGDSIKLNYRPASHRFYEGGEK